MKGNNLTTEVGQKNKSVDILDKNLLENNVIQYPTRDEYIRERFNLEILDAYHNLTELVRNGNYGFVLSEYSQKRSTEFIRLIQHHIYYNYYKQKNEYFDRHGEDYDSNSSEEIHFWGEKKNKFAYT